MSNKVAFKAQKTSDSGYRLRLSQCMIVKNEEHNIEKALSWAKDIAMEQIVVDTGSTDRTVKIAEAMGAKVYHFDWIEDFAAAKNYAIDQASGDWIAFLDADEYMSREDAGKLAEIIKAVDTREETVKNPVYIIRTPLININENGVQSSKHLQDRIFRRHKDIRYHGRIHEQIIMQNEYGIKGLPVIIANDITIWHTGYQATLSESKSQRNIALLERELKENPGDYDIISYLADCYSMKGDNNKAYEMYYDCIKHIDRIKSENRQYYSLAMCMKLFASAPDSYAGSIDELYDIFKKHCEESPDYDYFKGQYLYNIKEYGSATDYMQRAMSRYDSFNGSARTMRSQCTLEQIYGYIAYSYFKLHMNEKALENLIIYQGMNRTDNDSLMKIIYIISNEPIPIDESRDFIIKILSGIYDLTSLRDALICIKAATILSRQDLVEEFKSHLSESDRKWLESDSE